MKSIVAMIMLGLSAAACAGSFPVPTQRMADAESAERSARELGAASQPQAQLHLRLAQEQVLEAQKAVKKGDNQRADQLLIRATADAELALSLARERTAQMALQQAMNEKVEASK